MEELKERLRQAAAEVEAKKRSKENKEDEDEEVLFGAAYLRLRGERDKDNPPSSSSCLIPRFFSVPPAEGDALGHKLREEARAEFLQRRSRSLLDNEELKGLWALLDAHAESSSSSSSSSTDSPPEQVRRRPRNLLKCFPPAKVYRLPQKALFNFVVIFR